MSLPELSYEAFGKILIVDDAPHNLQLLSTTLSKQGYKVRCAKNGRMALRVIEHDIPDLILLDIRMPDMSGYDVCQNLQNNPDTSEIPIIFLSASNEVEEKLKAFEIGGVDYITKPFEVSEVLARVKTQMNFLEAKSKIRKLNAELEIRVQERTAALKQANQSLEQEIQERRKIEDQLLYDALHDSLTDLPNRNLFIDRVDQVLRHSKRYEDNKFAILFIDLDRFKVINDSLGHFVGDQLLISFAKLLNQCVRNNDTVARLGGDEFTILLESIEDISQAIQIAERIQEKLKSDLPGCNSNFCTSASIGIVIGNDRYENASELLRDADLAMYQAKELGKAQYAVFNSELHAKALRRLAIESHLRTAVQNQELLLFYQPIFCLNQSKLVGFESLLRWQDPYHGIISAGEFIPIAEESGLIVPIGVWALKESCHQLKRWQACLPNAQDLTISVNLSSKQFHQGNLLETIDEALAESQLNPKNLKLEITESLLLEDNQGVIDTLLAMNERGIKICMDDFGTGYSSLSYLHRFPIDVLKIDRSFVNQMMEETEKGQIVRTIITLGHSLGMELVAEGLETQEQVENLTRLNCDFGQGYFFSRPLNQKSTEEFIQHMHSMGPEIPPPSAVSSESMRGSEVNDSSMLSSS